MIYVYILIFTPQQISCSVQLPARRPQRVQSLGPRFQSVPRADNDYSLFDRERQDPPHDRRQNVVSVRKGEREALPARDEARHYRRPQRQHRPEPCSPLAAPALELGGED